MDVPKSNIDINLLEEAKSFLGQFPQPKKKPQKKKPTAKSADQKKLVLVNNPKRELTRRTTRSMEVKISVDRLKAYDKQIDDLEYDRKNIATEWAKLDKEYRDRLESVSVKIIELNDVVKSGIESIEIEVDIFYDYENGEVVERRVYDGEIFDRRPMTTDERQMRIPLESGSGMPVGVPVGSRVGDGGKNPVETTVGGKSGPPTAATLGVSTSLEIDTSDDPTEDQFWASVEAAIEKDLEK